MTLDGVAEAIRQLLRRITEQKDELSFSGNMTDETFLYEAAGGLGLDSLDTAELSILLEHRFGNDPYTAGLFPQTIGEIVSYYTRSSS